MKKFFTLTLLLIIFNFVNMLLHPKLNTKNMYLLDLPMSGNNNRKSFIIEHKKENLFSYLTDIYNTNIKTRKNENNKDSISLKDELNNAKTSIERLEIEIKNLKKKLFKSENVDIDKMIKEKKVYTMEWLNHQFKLARMFQLDELLNK